MARSREIYRCSSCQAQSSQWKGQCPSCQEWNTLKAVPVVSGGTAKHGVVSEKAIRLIDAEEFSGGVFSTGLAALDQVFGHGLMPGAVFLLGGEPGIGKSTLLLQVAGAVAQSGRLAVYVSGEESLIQIRGRGQRLGVLHERLFALSTSQVEDILPLLEGNDPPALVIIDSIQTLSSGQAEGLPGNVSQVRAVASELIERCKKAHVALVLLGHVTKDGVLAGPRLLEHMVDTVVSLEGDRQQVFRLLRVLKNRFGPNQELLVFQMTEKGLALIDDPSTYFLNARDPSLSGTALLMALDGQRALVVEVQALATRTYLSIPRRTALGFDVNRLHLLLAVLEKRLHVSFAQMDIYAKVGGGIKVQDPGMDLPLVAAVLSSLYDKALPARSVFWGELDLNGQIRPVFGQASRAAQALRLGYTPFSGGDSGQGSLDVKTLGDFQKCLFGKPEKQKRRD